MSYTEPCLGALIEMLEAEKDRNRVVGEAFSSPHSYRGYYEDLAFEADTNRTINEMLTDCRWALGNTFEGWKGGEYTMRDYSTTWIVAAEGECGETLGPRLLSFMLKTEPVQW